MSVTARVLLALSLASLAAVVALFVFAEASEREAREARIVDAVTAAMSAGGRERCERDPARFIVERRAGGVRRRARDDAPRRGRARRVMPLVGSRFAVYAHDGTSASGAPALDPSSLEEFERSTLVVLGEERGVVRYLVHMPWEEGPCAIVGVEHPAKDAELSAARRSGLGLSLVVVIAAALAVVFALRAPLARLRALTRAAEALGRSGFRDRERLDHVQLEGSDRDEVSALARSLRAAVDRIAEDAARLSSRDAALTEYVAHTTHDLMTPITVLTGDLAEIDADLRERGATFPKTIARAIGEAHYLGALIANLGVVARLDRPDPILQRRTIDLRDVVERVASRHEPLARARGLQLDFAVPDAPCELEGDDLLLERALGNLVHNAIRHHAGRAPGEGHVAIVLSERAIEGEARVVELRVLDDGRGLDDATLALLAARARGEAEDASTSASRTRSVGYGLDVVRRVAALSGLRLEVERAEEGGLLARLVGPGVGSSPPGLARRRAG